MVPLEIEPSTWGLSPSMTPPEGSLSQWPIELRWACKWSRKWPATRVAAPAICLAAEVKEWKSLVFLQKLNLKHGLSYHHDVGRVYFVDHLCWCCWTSFSGLVIGFQGKFSILFMSIPKLSHGLTIPMPRKDHNVDSTPLPRVKFGCRRDMDEISF